MEYLWIACLIVYLAIGVVHMFVFAPQTSRVFTRRGIPIGLYAIGITMIAGLLFPLVYLVGGLLMAMDNTQ